MASKTRREESGFRVRIQGEDSGPAFPGFAEALRTRGMWGLILVYRFLTSESPAGKMVKMLRFRAERTAWIDSAPGSN
jgi:hypothetical protein